MILKYLKLPLTGIALALTLYAIKVGAFTQSVTVANGTMTNVWLSFNQPTYVKQIIITSTTATNAVAQVVDTSTNLLTYTVSAYTNVLSYATNWNTTWTNFYGNVQTNPEPIVALIDYATNAVPSTTNSYPYMSIGAAANTTYKLDQVNYYFRNGIWVTNIGSSPFIFTIVY